MRLYTSVIYEIICKAAATCLTFLLALATQHFFVNLQGLRRQDVARVKAAFHLTICMREQRPGGGLADFYDGGDHVRPFSQTPKYVDKIFQRPHIC